MEELSIRSRIIKAMSALSDVEFLQLLEGIHAADLAEVLETFEQEERSLIFEKLSPEMAADVLVEFDQDERIELIASYSSEEIAQELVGNMDSDDAADLLSELSDDLTREVLSQVEDVEQAKRIAQLLTHEEDTAGALMATELVKVSEDLTALRCVAAMRNQAENIDKVHAVYVVNDDEILVGTLSLKKLLTAKRTDNISDLYRPIEHSVLSTVPAEDVANMMQKYDLFILPVVNAAGELLGRITLDDVVDFIREEAERDYQLASGLTDEVESDDSVYEVTRARIPWLLIGLFGGLIVALIIGKNEEDIRLVPALAFFMPLIAAMAGNVGVQSSAIVVQSLASHRKPENIGKKLIKELSVGLFNGLILSVVMYGAGLLLGYDQLITLTVSISLLTVIVFASLFGTFIPLMLNRFKIDAALATGPFITTANDVIGLIIYFQIGRLIIGY
ncbi:MAG: magnesium transporter [Flavobacteriales bacterium]|jgi:magnesium transporter|tara:strand:- start:969 stop:2312 length:1344 start_codon:yes stop_codon:yes gene_type:complete